MTSTPQMLNREKNAEFTKYQQQQQQLQQQQQQQQHHYYQHTPEQQHLMSQQHHHQSSSFPRKITDNINRLGKYMQKRNDDMMLVQDFNSPSSPQRSKIGYFFVFLIYIMLLANLIVCIMMMHDAPNDTHVKIILTNSILMLLFFLPISLERYSV
uniref:Uncharacterized protein n=1 Tax=Metapenaeus ensis majanivirus TaxID=2984279 RepID=A0A9C7F833_9VIRU|nr:MAG: hypothetical protein [Metapenaeus ensis majanivirus]